MDVTDEIVAAYVAGATYAEIRERFGVGTYQIRSRLRVAGVAPMPYRKPRGGRTPPSPAMVAKARALRDQGLTWREIGAEVHRSRRSVARWFAAAVEEGEA